MRKHKMQSLKQNRVLEKEYELGLITSIQFTKPMQIELSQLLRMMFRL